MNSITQDMKKVTIDSSSSSWKDISKLKVGSTDQDHRGSMQVGSVSVLSEDSRRLSFFADAESQLTKIMSGDSSDLGEEERKDVRPEEVFTDKARAAMVVIGTKDIKEALDRKKAVEIFRRTPEARNAAIFFQQARFLVHQCRYKEALVLINKALPVDPERKEWLTERSRCYFKMLQPEVALKHVNEVLALDPKYFKALLLKGEILYSMWDLERAMLCFVEGRRLRPDNTECIQGVHKIRMALDEISAYRDATTKGKRKKIKSKRSKSAKGRLVSSSPSKSTLKSASKDSSRHLYSSKFSQSSDKSSSGFSFGDEGTNKSPLRRAVTAHGRRKIYKTKVELRKTMSTSEAKTTQESQKASHQSSKSQVSRPKTAIGGQRSKSPIKMTGAKDWLESIKMDEGESSTRSVKSYASFKLSCGISEDDGSSDHSTGSSFSSSMEDLSQEVKRKPVRKTQSARNYRVALSAKKSKPATCIGPTITHSLEKDKDFLESILKNKGLKSAKTSYTKKALRIARDLHKFVVERREYWKNREQFIRYAEKEDDMFK